MNTKYKQYVLLKGVAAVPRRLVCLGSPEIDKGGAPVVHLSPRLVDGQVAVVQRVLWVREEAKGAFDPGHGKDGGIDVELFRVRPLSNGNEGLVDSLRAVQVRLDVGLWLAHGPPDPDRLHDAKEELGPLVVVVGKVGLTVLVQKHFPEQGPALAPVVPLGHAPPNVPVPPRDVLALQPVEKGHVQHRRPKGVEVHPGRFPHHRDEATPPAADLKGPLDLPGVEKVL